MYILFTIAILFRTTNRPTLYIVIGQTPQIDISIWLKINVYNFTLLSSLSEIGCIHASVIILS